MPWGAVAGAVVSYGLNEMGGKDKNGGAGTQTNTKEPWQAAQPWIMNNMQQGQALQNQLTTQPFSAQQEQAYNNSYAQSDYMRRLVPSLLGQMQNQQVGFDRTGQQPNKQNAWDWAGLMGAGQPGIGGGSGTMQAAAQLQAELEAAKKANRNTGAFTNYDPQANPMGNYYGSLLQPQVAGMLSDNGGTIRSGFLGNTGGAGFGEFKYGQEAPKKGTQAYRDMQEYIAYGGNDPYGLYTPLVQAPQNQHENAGSGSR